MHKKMSSSLEPFTGLRLLLHRDNSNFFILGGTGNVYTITLSTTPSCTCPDPNTPCKHMIFLYIQVLSVPINDPCLARKTLRPCQLTRLLSTQVSCETLASAPIKKRFLELYRLRNGNEKGNNKKVLLVNVENGSMCPICLEEMGCGRRRVVACATCKNPIHRECIMAWKKKMTRTTTCVICRARWREIGEQGKYINLSTFVSQQGMCGVNVC